MFTTMVWLNLVFMFALCEASVWIIHKDDGSLKTNSNGTVYSALQSTRKTLKRVRKWQTAHKAEVALTKCVSKYFKDKLPEVERRDIYDDYAFEVDEYDSFQTRRRRQNDQLEKLEEKRNGNGLTLGIGKNEERQKAREAREVRQNKLANLSNSDSHFANALLQTDTSIDTGLVWHIWYTLALVCSFFRREIYQPYLAPYWENKLFTCGKNYAVSKFWDWVDAAPE